MTKKPTSVKIPNIAKTPRFDPALTTSSNAQKPAWIIGALDLEGQWGWKEIEKEYFFNEIILKIRNFEGMSWQEILGRNNHEVYVYQISKEAQKRLSELQVNDVEKLVSLRLSGQERIWGIRVGNILKILWWDPEHTVYPSQLKHT